MDRITTKLLVELPQSLAQRLTEEADRRGATKGGIVRVALETYLRQLSDDENERFIVELPPGVVETFAAYRDVSDNAKRDTVIERAISHYIETKIAAEATLGDRIKEAQQARARTRMRIVEHAARRESSERG